MSPIKQINTQYDLLINKHIEEKKQILQREVLEEMRKKANSSIESE